MSSIQPINSDETNMLAIYGEADIEDAIKKIRAAEELDLDFTLERYNVKEDGTPYVEGDEDNKEITLTVVYRVVVYRYGYVPPEYLAATVEDSDGA